MCAHYCCLCIGKYTSLRVCALLQSSCFMMSMWQRLAIEGIMHEWVLFSKIMTGLIYCSSHPSEYLPSKPNLLEYFECDMEVKQLSTWIFPSANHFTNSHRNNLFIISCLLFAFIFLHNMSKIISFSDCRSHWDSNLRLAIIPYISYSPGSLSNSGSNHFTYSPSSLHKSGSHS